METTRMSSRGQVVIPQDVREAVQAEEGTLFAVAGIEDAIVLRKIETPSKEEIIKQINDMAKKETKRLKAAGFKEEDLWKAVDRLRARHRTLKQS